VSGVSEVSGVAGDGEREQAVTEEEDMVVLRKGEGEERWTSPPEPVATQLPIRVQGVHRSGLEDKERILDDFLMVKIFRGLSGVCRGRWLLDYTLVVIGREENAACSPRASVLTRTPATMKRVADSQLTKDTEDGDDGSEVNGLRSVPCYPAFTPPCSRRRAASASGRPQTPNSLTGGMHAPSTQSPIPS
jgi:hypothetical protein